MPSPQPSTLRMQGSKADCFNGSPVKAGGEHFRVPPHGSDHGQRSQQSGPVGMWSLCTLRNPPPLGPESGLATSLGDPGESREHPEQVPKVFPKLVSA